MNKTLLKVYFLFAIFFLLGSSPQAFAQAFAQDKLPNSAIAFGKNRNEVSKLHSYFGIAPGIGQASGTQYPLNSGFVYGATAGLEVDKAFGIALTYQHDSFSYSGSKDVGTDVNQLIIEVNMFSLLVLNGGFHFADVIRTQTGYRSADLGFGLHIGLDVSLTDHITAGVTGYWTLVMEQEDHHSLLNLMVPLKYWF